MIARGKGLSIMKQNCRDELSIRRSNEPGMRFQPSEHHKTQDRLPYEAEQNNGGKWNRGLKGSLVRVCASHTSKIR